MGTTAEVPTLLGHKKVKVPPGTHSHTKLRLKGVGIPDRSGRNGDQLVRVLVKFPSRLTEDQTELVKKLRETGI